ncbi:hypothetical protein HMPREF3201_01457 [Megasphaera sp. MJR8396C]|nr:hypothetical protein HMPREF3201_01457 [Megasphaera sp. MJR8396C]
MTVDGDVDVALFQGPDIYFGRSPMADAEDDVRCDVGSDDAGKAEGQTAAQELFHDALPVPIGTDAGAMVGVKDFVVGTDGDDVEVVPDFLPFCRSHGFNRFVVIGQRAGEVGQEDVGQFAGKSFDVVCIIGNAEGFADLVQFFNAEDGQVQPPFGDEFQGQQDFTGVGPVLGNAGGGTAQEVARYDEVGIGAADAARCFRRNLTGTHVAVLTADAGKAEGTLWFLLVKAVEGRITADLFHAQQHFTDSRVRRLFQHILLGGEGLAIFGNGLHVVIDAAVDVGVVVVMGMDMIGQTVMMMVVIVMMVMVMIVMVFMVMIVMVFMVMIVMVLMVMIVMMFIVMMMFMVMFMMLFMVMIMMVFMIVVLVFLF